MKERFLIASVFLLLLFPLVSAELSDSFNEIQSYVNQYNSGEINAPQLIVYVEYVVNKIYEESDRRVRGAFSELEIKSAFKQTDANPWEGRSSQFERVISTKDFSIIFTAHQYYQYSRDYWENREDEAESYYTIGYHLSPLNFDTKSNIVSDIKEVIEDLEYLSENENKERFEETRDRLSRIQQNFWNSGSCEETMEQLDMESYDEDDPYTKEKVYFKIIRESKDKNCWDNTQCENVCETVEVCEEFDTGIDTACYEKEVCEDVETCDTIVVNESSGETGTVCTTDEVCELKEVCDSTNAEPGNRKNCYEKNECYDECDNKEQCDEFVSGELRLEARCSDQASHIFVGAWGDKYDPLNHLNDGSGWTCESEVEDLVSLRKVLQKDLNNDFAEWFFNDFLSGEDYERIINGEHGFRTVLRFVTQNEEDIANRVNCMEKPEWPQGFERLEIDYKNENVDVEVWEKIVPVEWSEVSYYTTLYKYSWIPSKELLKGLIDYKIDELNDIGPSPKEIAEIRNDPGQMEIINSLSENYGGSLDVSFELNDEEGNIVRKYLTINPNVTMGFFDESHDGETDISLEVEFNSLYEFMDYIAYQSGGREIQGPNWVRVEGDGGPGEFFGVLGAVSKFWREGIKIKPRYALLKILFNSGDIISLMNSGDNNNDRGRNSVEFKEQELVQR